MTNAREDRPAGRGGVTITDVANAAGVSASTVSYVITGKRTISAATRRRVEECMRTLGYRRRAGSAAPTGTRIGVLAVVAPLHRARHVGLEMEFFSAAAGAARERGFDLLLVTEDDGLSGLLRVTSAALADAVIVLGAGDDDPRVPVLLASGRPAVLVGVPGRGHGLGGVPLDFGPAGEECATHLADLGHRSVGHLGPSPTPHDRSLSGFTEHFAAIAARRGVRVVSHRCHSSAESVTRGLDELFAVGEPTALVVHDEPALPLVMAALRRRGLRVPGDVSVVALCSATVAGQQAVRPTAVVVPARQLGALAVESAVRQLDGAPAAEAEPLTPRLTVGESTAVAP
ncbi:LacI family DNA-binding transcriptional regulator [Amycolatopsis sp. cmx-4-68]|uniref:LacI family DNA-binding transcriptional regulator n=1 Tax=Amycolatopsis sp. cmx-4-68 TaxID=2790938 RepID=UPI00397E554F